MSEELKEISKTYDPSLIEDKWYSYWTENGFFNSEPDEREPYTIVIPPPNVTGVLHMGHMMNNTIQDVLIRRKRMQGFNACWVPGTDHASIATEAKVVAMLRERGIKKGDLSREDFLKYAWEWKEKYGGIILEQLKKLGASCDWKRTRFTMEDSLSEAVIEVFIDLYNKGYIYRGMRMVNWDPVGKTALSDEEVIFKETNSKLYYVRYPVFEKGETVNDEAIAEKLNSNQTITIATVRPETILGDTAVCVHPKDERYFNLHDKLVLIPIVNRLVKVITDDYIDIEFGTGALKVTPAHDTNDYQLGLKHNLEVIDTINPDGTMSEAAQFYIGEDRFIVRKKIVKDLEAKGFLVKAEDYKNKIGHSERTDAVIEPKLSLQWFMKMEDISKPALENVLNGNIKLIPEKFINTYRHWMENVRDWCISRQLWWGQRIPAWYDENGNFVVAKTLEEAQQLFTEKFPNLKPETTNLKQDDDVLDTWFSSWLWPISVFDGFKDPNNKDINYYYPTNDLITAPEILFFWVARMIIAGYEYRNAKPFTNVYLTGIVRDKLGRKMSKSLGNSQEPLELIAKYSADGVRVGMLLCSPAGNDLLFDESYCEQGRNFANKIWNAFRLIKSWKVGANSDDNSFAINWFESKLNQEIENINSLYEKYRISEALMATYKLVWDDFCSWYLEMIKPQRGEADTNGDAVVFQSINQQTYDATISFFERILKLLHPFTPFITEELWHELKSREQKDCIIISQWPVTKTADEVVLLRFESFMKTVIGVRAIRNEKNISPKIPLQLHIKATETTDEKSLIPVLKKLCNLNAVQHISEKPSNAASFIVNNVEYYIPLAGMIDNASEREKILKEIDYAKGFLKSVEAKLGNANFVAKAKPEIIASEQKKKADAEATIKTLTEQLEGMAI